MKGFHPARTHKIYMFKLSKTTNYNEIANVTLRLIGQRQEFATVYSAIYRRTPDVMSNVVTGQRYCFTSLTKLTPAFSTSV